MEIENYLTKNIKVKIQGDILASKETKFQMLKIMQTEEFGRILLLGDKRCLALQFSEKDEAFYHEALVHPAMATHKNPKNILVLGGSDGGTLKEVLKHPIKKVTLVELDKDVISFCKEHFQFSRNAFDNEKINLIISDGRKFLEETQDTFDVMIFDLTDPSRPSRMLFTKEMYELAKAKMTSDGVIVTQASSPTYDPQVVGRVHKAMELVFENVIPYTVFIPSFFCANSFMMATKGDYNKDIKSNLISRKIDLNIFTPENLEKIVFEKNNPLLKEVLSKSWEASVDENPVES